jgi:hypothetical protein
LVPLLDVVEVGEEVVKHYVRDVWAERQLGLKESMAVLMFQNG